MAMQNFLTFLFVLFLAGSGFSQKDNRNAALSDFDTALGLLKSVSTEKEAEAKLMDAKKSIDLAEKHQETSSDYRTLKAMGDIYFELNRLWSKNNSDQTHVAGQKSKEGYLRAKKSTTKSKELDEVDKQLRNLQMNLYNQGVEEFNSNSFGPANKLLTLSMEIAELRGENDAQQVYVTAMSYDLIEDYESAYKLYRKCIELDYGGSKLYSAMLNSAIFSKNHEWVNKTIADGKATYPNDQDFAISTVNAYLFMEDYTKAEEALQIAIKTDPSNANLTFVLGSVYEKLGKTDRAIDAYKTTLSIDPSMFDANYQLGAMFFNDAVAIQQKINTLDFGSSEEKSLTKKHLELLHDSEKYLKKAYDSNSADYGTVSALMTIYAMLERMDEYALMKSTLDRIKNGN